MDKQILISESLQKLSKLGVQCIVNRETDLTITAEFIDSGWSTGNKKINYEACVLFDESLSTVFMWELTTEQGSGFSFGGGSETSFQSGTTLYRKVKSVQYSFDGKAYEISLDLGAITKAIKETAKQNGWSFKTVIGRDKALYPQGYVHEKQIKQDTGAKVKLKYCGSCGLQAGENDVFCENCGTKLSEDSGSGAPYEQVNASHVKQVYQEVSKPAANTVRFGKTIKVSLTILSILVIGMFWLMKASFAGWILAIVTLSVLYLLSGSLSRKGCLPLILIWLAAIFALFFIFVYSI